MDRGECLWICDRDCFLTITGKRACTVLLVIATNVIVLERIIRKRLNLGSGVERAGCQRACDYEEKPFFHRVIWRFWRWLRPRRWSITSPRMLLPDETSFCRGF